MNELSVKNYVMILIDGSKIYLEKNEADMIKNAIKQGVKYIEIGDSLINISSISRIISGIDYKEAEKEKTFKRLGGFECPQCQNMIPQGKKCGNCW